MSVLDRRLDAEVAACMRSLDYFSRNYLKIRDTRGKVVPLRLRSVQRRVIGAFDVNPWIYVLKARKRGISTAVAARFFWKCMFTPGYRVKLLAQNDEAVREIFKIYQTFWINLPTPFRDMFCRNEPLTHRILFANSKNPSEIVAQTSRGEGHRGGTFQGLHCSEFALWDNIEDSIASAFNMVDDDADLIMETTAKGLNYAHTIWHENNGYQKLFIGWQHDETCVKKTRPKIIPDNMRALAKKMNLTKEQMYWGAETLIKRMAGNWNLFLQEFPTSPEDAFITSGARFFSAMFPGMKVIERYKEYAPPQKFCVYSMGVDTASGADVGKSTEDGSSDFSAFHIINCTNKEKPRTVATFYRRIRPMDFGRLVIGAAIRYGALVCVESNSYGLSIIEYLISQAYPWLYRRKMHDKTKDQWADKAGFYTDVQTRTVLLAKLSEFIERGKLPVIDQTLKAEMNTFVYRRHKAQAEKGCHDDMVVATALALIGMEQVGQVEDALKARKPANLRELLLYEKVYGILSQDETRLPSDHPSPSQEMWS